MTIDFVTGQGQPVGLLRDPISQLPHWYTKMFWDMVRNSGSDRSLVQSATLTLKYDLQRTRPSPGAANGLQSPYICDVSLLDVRGKSYCAHFEGMVVCRESSIALVRPPIVESDQLVSTLMTQNGVCGKFTRGSLGFQIADQAPRQDDSSRFDPPPLHPPTRRWEGNPYLRPCQV